MLNVDYFDIENCVPLELTYNRQKIDISQEFQKYLLIINGM